MPFYERLFLAGRWILLGLLFLGALLSAINNALSLVRPTITYWGSAALLLFWGILAAVSYFWGIAWIDAQGQRVRLRRLSAKTHFFFVGALLLLWAPRGIDQFRVVVPQQLQHPPAPQPQDPPANGSWRERTPKDAFSFTLDVVPSARSTRLTGINDLGDVIGTYNLNELRTQYFLRLSDGIPMAIKHPQAPDDTRLTGLNNKGEVVGNFHEATRTGHDQRSYGFVRRQDGTFESFDCLDSSNTEATAINDHGQIVGFALAGCGKSG